MGLWIAPCSLEVIIVRRLRGNPSQQGYCTRSALRPGRGFVDFDYQSTFETQIASFTSAPASTDTQSRILPGHIQLRNVRAGSLFRRGTGDYLLLTNIQVTPASRPSSALDLAGRLRPDTDVPRAGRAHSLPLFSEPRRVKHAGRTQATPRSDRRRF